MRRGERSTATATYFLVRQRELRKGAIKNYRAMLPYAYTGLEPPRTSRPETAIWMPHRARTPDQQRPRATPAHTCHSAPARPATHTAAPLLTRSLALAWAGSEQDRRAKREEKAAAAPD